MKILIIDDDIAIRSSLTFVLERAGYEPYAVDSPLKAMEFVRNTIPQLILLDMNFTLTTDGEEGLLFLNRLSCLLRRPWLFL